MIRKILDDLETDIANLNFMLTGDLTARTGCARVCVETDPCTHIPGDENLPPLHTYDEEKL